MKTTEKQFKDYIFNSIEMRFRADEQFYLNSSNIICHDKKDIKIDLRLTPASEYMQNPDKFKDELTILNGWFKSLYNHHGFINPEIINCLDRLIFRIGYVGKFKSQFISNIYADELYLIHDGILKTITT